MSKLVEKLRRISEGTTPSLGFRASAPSRQSMLLIAALSLGEVGSVKEVVADALAVCAEEPKGEAEILRQVAETAGSLPWGIWAKGVTKGEIGQLVEAGGDFLIFEATATATLLQEERIGKVLEIDPLLEDSLIRTIGQMPVDVVLIDHEGEEALTVSHLMRCQRLAGLTGKPLLVTASLELLEEEIQSLRGVGVDGIIVKARKEGMDKLAKLHQIMKSLPLRKPGERRGVILPRLPLEEAEEI